MSNRLGTPILRRVASWLKTWQARLGLLLDRDDRNLEHLTRAIALSPDNSRSYELRSQIWLTRGENERALADCNEALRRRPSAIAHNNRGVAYLKMGRLAEALADFNEAVKRSSGSPFYGNRGVAKARLGDLSGAVDDLMHALRLVPNQAWMHSELAKAYALLGKDERELEHWHATIRCARRNAAAYEGRGLCYQRQALHGAAIKNFDKALEIDPHSADCLIHRGRSYAALGRREQALADFDAAICLAPSAAAFIHRSGARIDWGQFPLALADIEESLKLQPEFAAAYSQRGLARLRLGEFDQALADLERAIELEPGEAIFFNNRGYVRQARGEHGRAIADYEAAMELSPQHPNACKNLALLLATSATQEYRDGARAVALAHQAIELSRGLEPSWHEILANAQAEAGDFEAARKSLAKASEPLPIRPTPVMPEEAPVQYSLHSLLAAVTIAACALGMARPLRSTEMWSEMALTLLPDGYFGVFLSLLAAFVLGRAAWRGLHYGAPRQYAGWLGIVFAATLGACDGAWSAISMYRELYSDVVTATLQAGVAWRLGYAVLVNTMVLYVSLGAISLFLLRAFLALLPPAWQIRLMGEATAAR